MLQNGPVEARMTESKARALLFYFGLRLRPWPGLSLSQKGKACLPVALRPISFGLGREFFEATCFNGFAHPSHQALVISKVHPSQQHHAKDFA
jgi:hypothetical protein